MNKIKWKIKITYTDNSSWEFVGCHRSRLSLHSIALLPAGAGTICVGAELHQKH